MELNLMENALDSLIKGLDYYKIYLEVNNPYEEGFGELKSAVIFIHHAAELILKRIISDINEILIVDDIYNENFLKLYSKILELRVQNPRLSRMPLFESLAGEAEVQTVGYSKLVRMYKMLVNNDINQTKYLDELGTYRNRIMHIGIRKPLEFYEVMLALNGTLKILQIEIPSIKVYYPKELKKFIKVGSYIDSLITSSIPVIQKYWETFWCYSFEELDYSITEFENENNNLIKFLRKNRISVSVDYGPNNPSTYFELIFESNRTDKKFEIITENYPNESATFFKSPTLENKIIFIYEHIYISDYDSKRYNFYYLKTPMQKEEEFVWRNQSNKEMERLQYSNKIFEEKLKTFAKNVIIPYFEQ